LPAGGLHIAMTKEQKKPPRRRKQTPRAAGKQASAETRAADATTIGWMVSVTTTLLCDIAAAATLLYLRAYPHTRAMVVFQEVILFAAAAIGIISLLILPVVFRVRRSPPPSGVTVFAICVALAPILALIVRNLR
jgi:hypothetical protein